MSPDSTIVPCNTSTETCYMCMFGYADQCGFYRTFKSMQSMCLISPPARRLCSVTCREST